FRTEHVSLRVPGEAPRVVTEPALVVGQVGVMCGNWETAKGIAKTAGAKISAIAAFDQQFLSIHPFLDGNGRTARALLMQQILDLFGQADMSRMDRGVDYHRALLDADAGDLGPLSEIISAIAAE